MLKSSTPAKYKGESPRRSVSVPSFSWDGLAGFTRLQSEVSAGLEAISNKHMGISPALSFRCFPGGEANALPRTRRQNSKTKPLNPRAARALRYPDQPAAGRQPAEMYLPVPA